MSFSQKVKSEIAKSKVPKNIENLKYELIGMYISNDCIKDEDSYFTSENLDILERYRYIVRYFCIRNNQEYNYDIQKQKNIYMLNCNVLNGLIKKQDIGFNNLDINLITSLLIGIFLGCGYVNDPKDNYHLEYIFTDEDIANKVNTLLNNIEISSNITKRKNNHIVYIKDGDSISNLLGVLGASSSLIQFEELRVEKEMNNNLNRVINCETANLNKAINASKKHIDNIKYLKQTGNYSKLKDNLKLVCDTREKYPELSLNELAQIIGISKSGLNNRFKKIDEIVKDLKENEQK
ncbi:MAG: DNA-binding protein WhiA [Clostridiales bacterium]|nr:DNA-binding protein WhiA [Clostridiales bacterium]